MNVSSFPDKIFKQMYNFFFLHVSLLLQFSKYDFATGCYTHSLSITLSCST